MMRVALRIIRRRIVTCLLIAFACWGAIHPIERAEAITIDISYTDEGSPTPHPENPSWDPAGTILKAHFAQAKQIWEQLLPGPGNLEFDFHWDDDIDSDPDDGKLTLGLTTDAGPFDLFIEINPLAPWYADPFPATDDEFSPTGSQRLFSGLSPAEQSTYFLNTNPPGALETGYSRPGIPGPVGAGGFDAASGFDLLTVILHEMGHALGIDGRLPNLYSMDQQFLGGVSGSLVLGGEGGHLAGNATTPGFLMCDACAVPGGRYYPSATDVFVAAKANEISDVHLQRVGRISSGLWNQPNAWIGGDVPSAPQDVYITYGGTVTLSEDASAKDLLVDGGSSLVVQDRILSSAGIFNFAGAATVSVDAGGIIYANTVVRGAADPLTAADSRVVLNSYEGGASTSANFNGNLGIGTGSSTAAEVTFDPSTITNWAIGRELEIGYFRSAHFVIDNAMDVTSESGSLGTGSPTGPAGRVSVSGAGSSWMLSSALRVRSGSISVSDNARLDSASGAVGTDSALASATVDDGVWIISGNLSVGPAATIGTGQGLIAVQNSGFINVAGNITVRGTTSHMSQIIVSSGGSLRTDGNVVVGPFAEVTFNDSTYAHSGVLGSETFENLGGTSDSGAGGLTRFMDTATAGNARFTNRPGATIFAKGGETHFYDHASAGNSTLDRSRFDNLPGIVSYGSGTTRFFNSASAGEGEFYNHPGFLNVYATVEFNDDSTGGNGTFVNLPGVLGQSVGGAIVFNDDSIAETGTYTSQGEGGTVTFNHRSNADHGTFTTADNVGGNSRIQFFDDSTAGHANFSMGANTPLQFNSRSTAADATITVRPGGIVQFAGEFNALQTYTTTAANAHIDLEGAIAPFTYGGHAGFSTWSTAGDAVITAKGGTANNAAGATIVFDYEGKAGNATLNAKSGVNGGAGGTIYFQRGGTGGTARLVVEQGGTAHFGGNYSYGGTTVGSIEGAGTFALNGSELRVGTRNIDTTVTGSIVDAPGTSTNGRLTKIGSGTLTLEGTNTYTGLTTVSTGALLVNGSVAGDVQVDAGATFGGSGTIAGDLNVADGAILAPGNSPGTLHSGSLTLNPASVLNFEFGVVSDLMIVAGDVTLDGVLNITAGLGFNAFGEEIITYGGTLTDNGLTIGSVPAGFSAADFQLDFSTPGEIHFLGPTQTVPGDYNFNGIVDAADYTVWRDHLGSATALPNDDTPGVGNDDYARWKSHFGQVAGRGGGQLSPIPESASLTLFFALVSSVLAAGRLRFEAGFVPRSARAGS